MQGVKVKHLQIKYRYLKNLRKYSNEVTVLCYFPLQCSYSHIISPRQRLTESSSSGHGGICVVCWDILMIVDELKGEIHPLQMRRELGYLCWAQQLELISLASL